MRGAGSKKSHSMNFALFTHWLHTDLGLELGLGWGWTWGTFAPTAFRNAVHTVCTHEYQKELLWPGWDITLARQYTEMTTLEGNRNRNRTRRRAHHIGYYWDWERGTEKKRELKGVTGKTKTGFVSLFFLARNWSFDGFGGEGVRMKRENGYIHKDLAAYLWNCFSLSLVSVQVSFFSR